MSRISAFSHEVQREMFPDEIEATAPIEPDHDHLPDADPNAPERWRPIPDWFLFEASNCGRIRSWRRRGGDPPVRASKPRYLEGTLTPAGYRAIEGPNIDGKRRVAFAHVLVLNSFVGPAPANHLCRHRNGKPADNRLSNLAWGTQLENMADAIAHGRITPHVERVVDIFTLTDNFIPIEAILPYEVWKKVDGYLGYEVSSHGRVGSLWRRGGPNVNWKLGDRRTILTPRLHKFGYGVVYLTKKDHHQENRTIHSLMMDAFSPKINPEHQVRHLNRTPSDCHISNLRWGTVEENARDKILHGTQHRGSQTPGSKLDEAKVGEIRRRLEAGEIGNRLAKEFGVGHPTIIQIRKRRTWKHVP